jgi:hypothetical protein
MPLANWSEFNRMLHLPTCLPETLLDHVADLKASQSSDQSSVRAHHARMAAINNLTPMIAIRHFLLSAWPKSFISLASFFPYPGICSGKPGRLDQQTGWPNRCRLFSRSQNSTGTGPFLVATSPGSKQTYIRPTGEI